MSNACDPLQSILDQIGRDVNSLEDYGDIIEDTVTEFRNAGLNYLDADITPAQDFINALDALSPDGLGCAGSQINPIKDFVEDCFNRALAELYRVTGTIVRTVDDALGTISDLVGLNENNLMSLLQNVRALYDQYSIANLVRAIDEAVNCVTSQTEAAEYIDQVDDYVDRVDAVKDKLFLDDDGNFSFDNLTQGFNSDLKNNLENFTDKAIDTEEKVTNNVRKLRTTVNPSNYF